MKNYLIFLFFVGCVCSDLHSSNIPLVVDSSARAVIVISKPANGCVSYAASELQGHIEKITGAKIPINEVEDTTQVSLKEIAPQKTLILVGENTYARQLGFSTKNYKTDGFRIDASTGCLIIIGKDDKEFNINYRWAPSSCGTLYGVYRFLERLGVRWFYPEDTGTVIPKTKDIYLEQFVIEDAPYFPYRFTGSGDDAIMKWRRRTGAGGDRTPWSTMHTFFQTVPFAKKYGATHPEYFSVGTDGKRTKSIAFAHPGVIDVIINEAKDFFRSPKPDGRKFFNVIPDDAWPGCFCPICQAKVDREKKEEGMWSDYVGEAVMKVAQAVRDDFPNYYIVYTAYQSYKLPPKKIKKFPPNVVVLIAMDRTDFYKEENRTKAYDLIKRWQEIEPSAIYFCRYSSHLTRVAPSFYPNLISEDIKNLKKISEASPVKIKGEMDFSGAGDVGNPYSWWYHLQAYITAKLLWNPDTDVEVLMEDYYQKFYGPAVSEMRSFFKYCEQLFYEPFQLYKVGTIDKLDNYLKEAKNKTQNTPYAMSVKFISKQFELLRMMRTKLASAREDISSDEAKDLVLYFPFDEGEGSTTKDVIGNRIGSIANAKWVEGKFRNALEFSGDQSCVQFPELSLADSDYTIEAWIKPGKLCFTGTQCIVGPSAYIRLQLMIKDGKLWLWHRMTGVADKFKSLIGTNLSSPSFEFVPGRWYHVVGTFSKTTGMAIYIDGTPVAMDTTRTDPSSFPIFFIGATARNHDKIGPGNLIDCFEGVIDEVRIYKRELSYEEVREHYQKGK